MLDAMVVTVALPAIQHDLGIDGGDLQWVVTAYTLSLGAFVLVGGRAADLYGRRRLLMAGALASLGAGLARSGAALLAARAFQGAGAALAIPSALALLAASFPAGGGRERALGRVSAPLGAGMVVGLVLGGVVTAALGWLSRAAPAGLPPGRLHVRRRVRPAHRRGISGVRDGESGVASGGLQTSSHLGGALVL